jgi:hypothetical protein
LIACGNTGVSPGIDSSADPLGPPAGSLVATVFAYEGGVPRMPGSSASNLPVADPRLCSESLPTNTCVGTRSDGFLAIELDNVEVGNDVPFVLTATASGHLTTSGLGYVTVERGGWATTYPELIAMFDDERAGSFFGAAGFAYPPVHSGFIRVEVSERLVAKQIAGATVALAGGSAANGPVYSETGSGGLEVPDPVLTATGADGYALFGNVPPGDFSITVTVAGMTCTGNGFAWPGSNGATASGHLDSESFTDNVRVFCQ